MIQGPVVAKGLYIVRPHQSEVEFPWMFVVHFMHHIKVKHCNSFGGHCSHSNIDIVNKCFMDAMWRTQTVSKLSDEE